MSAHPSMRRILAIGAAITTICLLLLSSTYYAPGISKHTVRGGEEQAKLSKTKTGTIAKSHGNGREHSIKTHKPRIRKKPSAIPIFDLPKEEEKEKLAYLTLLSGTVVKDGDEDLENDNYFQATRILVWQLLHLPETRTKGIDVIVMVTPSVSESRRARLRQDGAVIHPVEFLASETHWEHGDQDRWNDVMTKLRAWEMIEYSRILIIDGDTMLLHPLDGVFEDPAAQIQATKQMDSYKPLDGEAPLPPKYLLAGLSEVTGTDHDFPPTHTTGLKKKGYFNAGFFMLAPSIDAYNHYRSVLNIPKSFDPKYPEQNLLNKIHNWDGPMPWKELSYTWNLHNPTENDFEKGVVSVHEKWWVQPGIDGHQKVKDWLRDQRWQMKGYYMAYDMLFRNTAGLFLLEIINQN
ncbi:nucleotide-diphospho-sugar transferase [Ophiobolus disseminans]|uniref:Nucleotide-diphospho-sugar transferase n=1 Tax=Ophiobolus disseminans TaxID=1469910 RepID=A0A6A6ZHG2_9PLEO|nr:nucleotide-diphospho-sugar transferase [Ophiobolus disseminans]